ncbi:MAG: ester cyclase [Desulfurococcales archaeon]|nr:ester cyclase [Desulfurococcales archaeon]
MRRARSLALTLALIPLAVLAVFSAGAVFNSYAQQVSGQLADAARKESLLHWMYIAGEDKERLMAQYAEDAVLYWIGGPLTGVYRGVDNISALWDRFFMGNEDEHVRATNVRSLEIHGKVYVVADVSFITTRAQTGEMILLDLTYILVFRQEDGSLLVEEEWWIIDSATKIG